MNWERAVETYPLDNEAWKTSLAGNDLSVMRRGEAWYVWSPMFAWDRHPLRSTNAASAKREALNLAIHECQQTLRAAYELLDDTQPTDVPSLARYLKRHPRVEQTHPDPVYGTRVLRYYGNHHATGNFQFDVEGQPGRSAFVGVTKPLSEVSFGPEGFDVRRGGELVRHRYLPDTAEAQ